MKHITAAIVLFASAAVPAQDAPLDRNDPDALWSQATLYRDEWGVPHIYAESLRAMAFAFGYAQAEDHLDAMLLAFRAVQGRSAEVLGEDRLPQDTYALQMRFDELAKEAFETADPEVRDLCEGFALGVNSWLLDHRAAAPDWAEGIQPHEVLSLLHAFLLAHAPFDLPEADVRDPGMLSAHAWAVAPEHTTQGHTMLVANPHAEFEGIYRWYEAHLVADGYEVAGATIYGLPVLLMGHTPFLGWSLAPNGADIADLYDENTFEHLKTTERYHDVYVKTDDGLEKRVVMTWDSGHGPIVATNMGRPLAWKVGGYGRFDSLAQLAAMGRAQDLDGFVDALNYDGLPAMNVLYGDADGNIYYAYNAVTGERPPQPLRASDDAQRTIWERPVPAYTAGFQWQEPIAPARLPALSNAHADYLIASGAPPSLAASDLSPVVNPSLAWLVRDRDTPHAERLRQLFDRGPRSFHDMQSMLFDHALPAARPSIEFLLEAAKAFPDLVRNGHPDLPVALDMLAEWDRIATPESTVMTWFHIWTSLYARLSAEAGPESAKDARQKLALRAASDASRLLINTYQKPFVPWGDVHVLQRGDVEFPLAGGTSGDPVFRSGDAEYSKGKWVADAGYAYAMIVQFTTPPTTVSLAPFGASDRPDSPHFTDQMTLLAERRLKVLHTARNDVLRAASSARGTDLEFIDHSQRVRVHVSAESVIAGRLVTAHRFERRTEDDLAAFSPFIEPVVTPSDTDITIDVEFFVPEHVCSADALEELMVYAYHPQTGWNVVDDQALDVAERTFFARDYYDQVYVVLGPRQHLRREPVAHPSDRVLAEIPVQLAPRETPEYRRTVRAPATDSLGEPLDTATERRAPEPMRTSRPEENPFGASPGVLTYTPDEEERRDPPPLPQVEQPEYVPPQVARAPEPEHVEPAEPAATDEPGYQQERRGDDTLVIRGRRSAEGSGPDRDSGSRLQVSYQPPVVMRGESGHKPFQLYLAPGSATASELQFGTDLDLSPPVQDVLLRLHAKSTVRAQGYIAETPPSPLPDGLVAFSPIVAAVRDPDTVPCTVAVTLRVPPARCSPANADKLTLYVHDPTLGWVPLETGSSPVPLSYQAIDIEARTYAVLGPASARIE